MALTSTLILAVVAVSVLGEDLQVVPCPNVGTDHCTISSVSITPCKEYPKPCVLRLKSDAAISFSYTPNFSATKTKSGVYWDGPSGEVPFAQFDPDGCKFTTCPLEAGKAQVYNYQMHVGAKLPKGTYPIVWKLWNEDDESQMCCFRATIKLQK